ncbi:MAG: Rrf2 family transcriptional regulator [candidate division Zixibacteria bacterium HGW-Zixibacteria-1]|nr:MAG: Rrf2 family transcriptional regulator [candidate division Zixibacteria bacterium HGW-Zixibacteria-1]
MQFTRAEEYGILGVIYLASQEEGLIVPLSEIAEIRDVPEKFLAKIFQNLTKTGIVKSHRGVKGGFSLAKDPEVITIKDVVEAIQGPYHLIKCLPDRDCCEKVEFCPIRPVLEEAEEKLLEVFGSYTLANLISWERNQRAAKAR